MNEPGKHLMVSKWSIQQKKRENKKQLQQEKAL